MEEEKSPNKEENIEKNFESTEFQEVDVSLDDDDTSEPQEVTDNTEGEAEPPIPEGWRGKPEAEIALLRENQELKLQLDEKEATWFDKYARLQAEFDNFRKRSLKERENYINYASAEVIAKILPVLDSSDNMLKSLEQKLEPDDLKGIKMFITQLFEVLEKDGLTPIKAKGEVFDPFVHEILMMDYTDDYPEDIIIEEFQRGYRFKGRVLRPSKVKIAKPKPIQKAKSDSEVLEVKEESDNKIEE